MKIAFLVTLFPTLSETFILNQITGLIQRGHEIDIYAYERSDNPKIHEDVEKYQLLKRTFYYGDAIRNIPNKIIARIFKGFFLLFTHFHKNPRAFLRSLNFFKFKREAASLRLLFKIVPFVEKGDYDVIHCHFGPNGNIGVHLKELGVFTGKIITAFHGYDITKYTDTYGKDVYKNLFEKGDLFLPISERWKNKLISLGCCENKIIIHRMGVDTDRYCNLRRNPTSPDITRIITIARFVEKKGIRFGIEAVGRIVTEHPGIEYSIIGDGPLKDEVESVILKMNLKEKVKLLGWKNQEEILECLIGSDILLLPSVTSKDGDQEGIPVVLMEAMALGTIVVSTYHSGIPELVQDGVSGFLAPERDVVVLAEKLQRCIEHREIWPTIRKEARKVVTKNYNISDLNDQLIFIYQKLLDILPERKNR